MKKRILTTFFVLALLLQLTNVNAQTWNMQTSGIVPPEPGYIGTKTGHFIIRSNGVAKLRFNDGATDFFGGVNLPTGSITVPTGSIGIGSTSPLGMLDVFHSNNKNRVYVNSGNFPSISFRNDNVNAGSWYHIHNTINTNGVNAFQISHGTNPGDNLVASFTNTGLGIGIARPNAKLDVQGGSLRQGTNELYDDAGNSQIRFNTSDGKTIQNGYAGVFRFNKDQHGMLEYYNTSSISPAGTTISAKLVFAITKEGRMSIGNLKPNSSSPHSDWKLSVDGAVLAKKSVVTQLNWADDEFDKASPSLKEEQIYANKEKHLLGVPSEKELSENALDLGEMSAIQMRKIEQLYKHLWQQQQIIEKLQTQIETLKCLAK